MRQVVEAARRARRGSDAVRFYDNRQKYLAFVTPATRSPRSRTARRSSSSTCRPTAAALRIFDAGMATPRCSPDPAPCARAVPDRAPALGRQGISLEDVRLGLEKMPDASSSTPRTVLVITNLNYSEAPRLMPPTSRRPPALNWHEVRLKGQTSDFVFRADRGARGRCSLSDGRRSRAEDRQSGLCARPCWWCTRGSQVSARPRHPETRPDIRVL